MNLKQFLKLDWRKIVIFAVLFIAIFLIGYYKYLTSDSWAFGVPFEFSSGYGPCPYPNVIECNKNNFIFLVLDVIIWYLLSCLIVWVYDKFRKKKDDYVHIKDVNMVMGQLEKWGKKK